MLSATKTVATEHVYRAKNNSKCVCSLWGLRPGPHVELTAFPEDPSWIGEAALGLGISQKISTFDEKVHCEGAYPILALCAGEG